MRGMDRTARALAAVVAGFVLALPATAGAAIVNVTPATPPFTATNNDYEQIEDAVSAANAGDEIVLDGTFTTRTRRTRPRAGRRATTASPAMPTTGRLCCRPVSQTSRSGRLTPGGATIQGPGDIVASNLEGVFVGDGGDNQGWTFRGLRFIDFDLAIGMFNGAGGADAFDGVKIEDNFIRVPSDLNSTPAGESGRRQPEHRHPLLVRQEPVDRGQHDRDRRQRAQQRLELLVLVGMQSNTAAATSTTAS